MFNFISLTNDSFWFSSLGLQGASSSSGNYMQAFGLLIRDIPKNCIIFHQPLSRSMYMGRRYDSIVFKINTIKLFLIHHLFRTWMRLHILFTNIKLWKIWKHLGNRHSMDLNSFFCSKFIRKHNLVIIKTWNNRLYSQKSFSTFSGVFYVCLEFSQSSKIIWKKTYNEWS